MASARRRFVARARLAAATLPLVIASPGVLVACGSGTTETAPAVGASTQVNDRHVVLVSIDGLNPKAIRKLGRNRTPTLHRIIRTGAATLNARTLRERTLTLPNHTGMITGRRVNARKGGHGVTFNHDDGHTVHRAAGVRVASVFDVVHRAGGSTALLTSKDKFAFFRRSWPETIDRHTFTAGNRRLARQAVRDLHRHGRAFTMVHFSAPDVAGHAHGFMSHRYLKAVKRTDRNLGRILRAVQHDPALADRTVVLVTADHGGPRRKHGHGRAGLLADYRVPLMAWGDDVAHGNLYALNDDFGRPGRKRTTYDRTKPALRNGMVANLSTRLLGLGAVPGSTLDRQQHLSVLR